MRYLPPSTRLVKSFSPQQLCQAVPSPSMFSTTTQTRKTWEKSGSTEPRILKSSGAVMDSHAFVAPLSHPNTLIVLLFYKCDFFYSSLFKSNIYAATLFLFFFCFCYLSDCVMICICWRGDGFSFFHSFVVFILFILVP